MSLFLTSPSQHVASCFATALDRRLDNPALSLKCFCPEMALVTSACILLVTPSYVTMPNIKRYLEISLGQGREEELQTWMTISNISPTFTYVIHNRLETASSPASSIQLPYSPMWDLIGDHEDKKMEAKIALCVYYLLICLSPTADSISRIRIVCNSPSVWHAR